VRIPMCVATCVRSSTRKSVGIRSRRFGVRIPAGALYDLVGKESRRAAGLCLTAVLSSGRAFPTCPISSVGRASRLQREGPGIVSSIGHFHGGLAHLEERLFCKQKARGSSPRSSTTVQGLWP
jgi:hypothetical protein